ncbi:hypothetical protein [Hymenobacter bucti]|uniref:Secreted protein n=1 Tax=Hymenobacter bucti TaxID=1844114 RepID=A0ABW4QN16_9BACT
MLKLFLIYYLSSLLTTPYKSIGFRIPSSPNVHNSGFTTFGRPLMELYREAAKVPFHIGPVFVFPKVHAVTSAALAPLLTSARPFSPTD